MDLTIPPLITIGCLPMLFTIVTILRTPKSMIVAGAAVATEDGVAYEVVAATEDEVAAEVGVVTDEGAAVVDVYAEAEDEA